jgi:hypothetical protein
MPDTLSRGICKCGLAKSYHGPPTNLADDEYTPRSPTMPDTPDLTHSSRDDLIHRIELLNADLAAERAHIDALTAAVEDAIRLGCNTAGPRLGHSGRFDDCSQPLCVRVLAILQGEQTDRPVETWLADGSRWRPEEPHDA